MNARAWFRLGRVSNLPTVWSNVLAAVALAGAGGAFVSPGALFGLLTALSLFYVAGMVLNDAFDAEIDARLRPKRPIPSGEVSLHSAFRVGGAFLAVAILALAAIAHVAGANAVRAGGAGLGLAGAIVLYDWHHKGNPVSPVLMGVCRAMVFVAVGATMPQPHWGLVFTGATLQLLYVIGLTYTAKQEDLTVPGSWWPLVLLVAPPVCLLFTQAWTWVLGAVCLFFIGWLVAALWPLRPAKRQIGVAVGRLIAGICLVDALLLASMNQVFLVTVACVCLLLTTLLQRYIPGT